MKEGEAEHENDRVIEDVEAYLEQGLISATYKVPFAGKEIDQVDDGAIMDLAWQLMSTRESADKTIIALTHLASKYPLAIEKLWDQLAQNGQMITPKLLVRSLAEMLWRPDIDQHFKNSLYSGMNYMYAFYGPSLNGAIFEQLDFKEPTNYFRTGTFLEFIKHLGEFSQMWSFSEESTGEMLDLLDKVIEKGEGSYLLNLRAKQVRDRIAGFGVYAPERNKEVTVDKEALAGMSDQDLYDLEYLLSTQVIGLIKEEFGIDVHTLPPKEQFWFLQFIKNKEASKIEPIKNFITQYGLTSLRTFLALDYGKELGDEIVGIGLENPEGLAGEVFDKYSTLIDKSSGLKTRLEEAVGKEFPNYVQEAFLRRAKDLLIASSKDIRGVLDAMDGLNLFLEITSDLGQEKAFDWQQVDSQDPQVKKFRIHDEGGPEYILRISTRAEKSASGQARINFELDFDTSRPNVVMQKAFRQTNEYPRATEERKKKKEASVLRLGLDLDERESTPELSLDFGRSKFEGEKLKRTGDILGNLLTLSGTNHTPESFPSSLANPESFKQIVLSFESYLETLYLESLGSQSEPMSTQKVA